MTSEIVTLKDGQPVTTSIIVADSFGKNHRDVLRSIDNILTSEIYQKRGLRNFAQTHYVHPQNGQSHRFFEMDRQGFEILAMGFTGEKALEWKLKYSDAFAMMEAELRRQSVIALPNFDDPIVAAEAWIAERKARRLECQEKEAALRQIEAMRPAQAFHDQIIGTEELWDLMYVFSVLQKKTGQEFNQRTWLDFLRRHGIAKKINLHTGIGPNRFQPRQAYIGSWFVGEPTGYGAMEWKIRPMAVSRIIRLIEMERRDAPFSANDDQEAA